MPSSRRGEATEHHVRKRPMICASVFYLLLAGVDLAQRAKRRNAPENLHHAYTEVPKKAKAQQVRWAMYFERSER
jgi:hypothetical protein